MTLAQGCGYFCKEYLFKFLFDFFLFSKSNNGIFNQPTRSLGAHLLFTIIPAATPYISKYIEKNLQQIFKTVLEI